jgi:hypothetical protein
MSIALSRGGRFLGRAPALNVSWRRTLIRPPLVKGQSGPVAGTIARVPQDTTMGLANAADFISTAASDSVVCTKHLLRLELETTTRCRPQRGERQRLRGLETHLCPPAGRFKAAGSSRRPVPVSTQLGRGGSPQLVEPTSCHQECRASTGVQSTHRTPGAWGPDAHARSGPQDDLEHRFGLGPIMGPVRRQALPCSSSAFSRSGSRSSLLWPARLGAGWSRGRDRGRARAARAA